MKNKILPIFSLAILAPLVLAFAALSPFEELPINSPVPMEDYQMKDVSGKTITLKEIKTDKGLLVIFSCNTCPYVKLSESRIKEFSDYCSKNKIGCILVNSNEAQRSEEDSFDAMVKYYKGQNLRCAYTVDEKSQLADAFGATRTPQCFLFDKTGLIYRGAIDDNIKDPSAAKAFYLKDALQSLIADQKPTLQQTKSIGCTIKRLE